MSLSLPFRFRILFAALLVLLVGAFAEIVLAQDTAAEGEVAPADPGPVLSPRLTDPAVPMAEFVLQLIPLTHDDLAAAAATWQAIVKTETEKVVGLQIALAEAEGRAEVPLRESLGLATEKRNALLDKYSEVLSAWSNKGADPAILDRYRQYSSSIRFEQTRTSDWRTLLAQGWKWLINPEAGLKWLFNIGVVIVTLIGLYTFAGIARRIARRGASRIPNLSKLLQGFLAMLAFWLTIAIGLLVVLSALGINITPVFALIGGASFIMAFALQDTLGNLAAGIMIMLNHPFDEGDDVDIGGVAGTVKSVSIVSTTVTTPDNKTIVVPNSKVWGNVITNVTASTTRRVDLTFGIGYEVSIETAQQVLEATVTAHPMVLADPAPMIRVNTLGASSVDFIVRPWVNGADYWTVYWDLTRQVKEAFDAANISIPFPQTNMHVHVAEGAPKSLPFVPAAAKESDNSPGAFARNDAGHDDR